MNRTGKTTRGRGALLILAAVLSACGGSTVGANPVAAAGAAGAAGAGGGFPVDISGCPESPPAGDSRCAQSQSLQCTYGPMCHQTWATCYQGKWSIAQPDCNDYGVGIDYGNNVGGSAGYAGSIGGSAGYAIGGSGPGGSGPGGSGPGGSGPGGSGGKAGAGGGEPVEQIACPSAVPTHGAQCQLPLMVTHYECEYQGCPSFRANCSGTWSVTSDTNGCGGG